MTNAFFIGTNLLRFVYRGKAQGSAAILLISTLEIASELPPKPGESEKTAETSHFERIN
tara:strand:+ start:420 stop:596 length:177 start_codon:yes stop_codon:yes gene_type:complete